MISPTKGDGALGRRDLLKGAALAAGLGSLAAARQPSGQAMAAASLPEQPPLVDTNVHLFQWPFRHLPDDRPERLINTLRSHGVTQAWAGSFEAVLHRDVQGVNARLAEACAAAPQLLLPFGTVNLSLPDWQEDLRRCHEEHRMPGIRLYPNYHGYSLADPQFTQVLALATARGLLVQLVVSLEDTRTQHPLLQVADVDLGPLAEQLQQVPDARLMLLNHRLRGEALARLLPLLGIHYDTARVESTRGIAQLARSASPQRVLFGSHAPFLIHRSALIKLAETRLSDPELHAIGACNAQRLLPTAPA